MSGLFTAPASDFHCAGSRPRRVLVASIGAVMRPAQRVVWGTWVATTLAVGCARTSQYANPSFPISEEEAEKKLAQLEKKPTRLERPLVILGGFLDIGIGPHVYARAVDRYVDGEVVQVTFASATSFDQCRTRLASELDRVLGNAGADETVEVDVIGQSMGGLVAIYAALDDPKIGKRLNVRRLFTISSPLSGARLAMLTPFNVFGFQADMRAGSGLYERLANTTFPFPIYSYTRLDDGTVGERYAALPGRAVWWVDNPLWERAHVGAFTDKRILLDIVLRLRGDKPITKEPPAPLPQQARPTTRRAATT